MHGHAPPSSARIPRTDLEALLEEILRRDRARR